MKIHRREIRCRAAESDLRNAIGELSDKHDLTGAEMLRIVNAVLSDYIASIAKYDIRQERHGNTDTPGGLEG